MQESPLIQEDVKSVMKGDCAKIESIEARIGQIKNKAETTCLNPLIRIAIDKIERIPIKCGNLNEFEQQVQGELGPLKELCLNSTPNNSA